MDRLTEKRQTSKKPKPWQNLILTENMELPKLQKKN